MKIKNVKNQITILALLFLTPYFAQTQSPQKQSAEQWIKNEIEKRMLENNIPSLSLAVVQDGQLIMQTGFGVKDRDLKNKSDENTIYQIASVAKTFTSIIANNLIEQGLLDLDESILTYLPDQFSEKAKSKLGPIKVRHVFYHRSGLKRNSKSAKRKDGTAMKIGLTEEGLLRDLERLKLDSKPDTEYSYSNLGYGLIGYILERASNETYENLLQKYVVDEYGLNVTSTLLDPKNKKDLATPYRKNKRNIKTSPWVTGKLCSASGVYSSAADLYKLLEAQMQAYQKYAKSGEDNALILTKEKHAMGEKASYGMGFQEGIGKSGAIYGHGGDMDGYGCWYNFNLDKQNGLVLLTSSGGDWMVNLAFGIMERLLNKP